MIHTTNNICFEEIYLYSLVNSVFSYASFYKNFYNINSKQINYQNIIEYFINYSNNIEILEKLKNKSSYEFSDIIDLNLQNIVIYKSKYYLVVPPSTKK